MQSSVFSEMAKDPTLVSGVYHHCDFWCAYCAVRTRCLVSRARALWEAERSLATSGTLEDAVAFTREVARATGQGTPELDALESGRPVRCEEGPLHEAECFALEYAVMSGTFLRVLEWRPPAETVGVPDRPDPLDVVGWYHLLIAAKVGRAFDRAAPAGGSSDEHRRDALGSAKVALIGVDRSRRALEQLSRGTTRSAIPMMLRLLRRLEQQIEACFPDARTFVRPGLDRPVA